MDSCFMRSIGITSSFAAKLWEFKDGLMMYCNLNISSPVVEMDTKAIVDVFNNSEYVNSVVSLIQDDCRHLAACFHRIQFKHFYWQANQCVNSLVMMSTTQHLDLTYFNSPPMDVISAFENDLNGMYFNRLCPEPIVVSQYFTALFFTKKKILCLQYFYNIFYVASCLGCYWQGRKIISVIG